MLAGPIAESHRSPAVLGPPQESVACILRVVEPGEQVFFHLAGAMVHSGSHWDGQPRPLQRYVGWSDEYSHPAVTAVRVDPRGAQQHIGVAILRPVVEGCSNLAEVLLYVTPDFRGRGLSRRLLDAAVELADSKGIRRLRLELAQEELAALDVVSHLATPPALERRGSRVRVEFPTAAYQ